MRLGLAELTIIGIALALLSIPPALGWVPRNRLYGFRVVATLRSDSVWYPINRRFGRILIAIGIGLSAMAMLLDAGGFNTPAGSVAMVVSLLITTVCGWRAANRMEQNS